MAPLSFECVCLSVYIGKGWSSVLPTSGVTSKWRKEALGKHDTDLGGPLCPEIDSPSQMGHILQPIFLLKNISAIWAMESFSCLIQSSKVTWL